jgi:uncharacterized membrane protein YfcA
MTQFAHRKPDQIGQWGSNVIVITALSDVVPNTPLLVELVGLLGLAGFVAGLGGFAFSGIASVTLWLLPPLTVIPLLLTLSTVSQLLTITSLWRHMRIFSHPEHGHGAWPYIVGGLTGVPVGVHLLQTLPPAQLAAILGGCLTVFAVIMLSVRRLPHVQLAGLWPAMVCGWVGGLVGGFSAFPSAPALTYLSLRHAPREAIRGQLQPFIVAMQVLSLGMLAWQRPAMFSSGFLTVAAICLPVVMIGTFAGVRCFHRIGDHHFRQAILALLLLSGGSLLCRWAFL